MKITEKVSLEGGEFHPKWGLGDKKKRNNLPNKMYNFTK